MASPCVDLTFESTENKGKNLKLGEFEFTNYIPVREETGLATEACFFLNGFSMPKKPTMDNVNLVALATLNTSYQQILGATFSAQKLEGDSHKAQGNT